MEGRSQSYGLGSTAEGILRHSNVPALTVGSKVTTLSSEVLKIRRILYASDCTAEAARGAVVAVALAGSFSAKLDVLNVIRTNDMDESADVPHIKERYLRAVEKVMPQNALQVCESRTFVSIGQPHTEILKHLEERQIDLLILGLQKRAHLGLKTSGAFPIIVEARCPVLTVASDTATHPR